MSDAHFGEPIDRPLILDACVVLNLYATRRMDEILRSLCKDVFVGQRVRDEALRVGHGASAGTTTDSEFVNLDPMIKSGALKATRLEGETELNNFVRLARELDDGEAECGAIAIGRSLRVATDDRKAIRIFGGSLPAVACMRTSEIMRRWAEYTSPTEVVLRSALRDIRTRARFEPSAFDPLRQWWMDSSED